MLFCVSTCHRGLDIPRVQVVINHNTPGLPKTYIHRVGRTARAGKGDFGSGFSSDWQIGQELGDIDVHIASPQDAAACQSLW